MVHNGGQQFPLMDQTPFQLDATDFAENPDPRCPSLLLLDVSGSMAGKALSELQAGLEHYRNELAEDPLASRRVEVALVTFGGTVQTVSSFVSAPSFAVPQLTATGNTPMAEAIVTGLSMLKAHKDELRMHGLPLFRPWVFLITDGAPSDRETPRWQQAIDQLREGERNNSFLFFAVGVQGADQARLAELSGERPTFSLDGLRFRDLFAWLSASQKIVSASSPGDRLALPKPDCIAITA
jgi:uncharacterized protein YegL